MKVSEHLAGMHKTAHAHHTQMVAAHEKVMEKIAGEEGGAHHVSFHKSAVASHQQMADYHEGAMEECQKAAAASDLAKANALVPDNVHGIIRNFPSVTAIPRAGQRQIEKTAVDPAIDFILAEIQD
jgi:hypothetical protein